MKKARRLSNEDVSAKFAQGCPQIDIVVICRDYVAVNAVERSVAVTLDIAVKALGGCLLAGYRCCGRNAEMGSKNVCTLGGCSVR
jgi:hypothetical protein